MKFKFYLFILTNVEQSTVYQIDEMKNNRTSIFSEIAQEIWDNELINQNNYDYNFKEFQKDFLKICYKEFDGIIFIRGKLIE